jgi:hypothetical protein
MPPSSLLLPRRFLPLVVGTSEESEAGRRSSRTEEDEDNDPSLFTLLQVFMCELVSVLLVTLSIN